MISRRSLVRVVKDPVLDDAHSQMVKDSLLHGIRSNHTCRFCSSSRLHALHQRSAAHVLEVEIYANFVRAIHIGLYLTRTVVFHIQREGFQDSVPSHYSDSLPSME